MTKRKPTEDEDDWAEYPQKVFDQIMRESFWRGYAYGIVTCALILVGFLLVGCNVGHPSDRLKNQDKFVITLDWHHGNPNVWTTPNMPYPVGGGWAFHLADGRLVMVSGSVCIEERK